AQKNKRAARKPPFVLLRVFLFNCVRACAARRRPWNGSAGRCADVAASVALRAAGLHAAVADAPAVVPAALAWRADVAAALAAATAAVASRADVADASAPDEIDAAGWHAAVAADAPAAPTGLRAARHRAVRAAPSAVAANAAVGRHRRPGVRRAASVR